MTSIEANPAAELSFYFSHDPTETTSSYAIRCQDQWASFNVSINIQFFKTTSDAVKYDIVISSRRDPPIISA